MLKRKKLIKEYSEKIEELQKQMASNDKAHAEEIQRIKTDCREQVKSAIQSAKDYEQQLQNKDEKQLLVEIAKELNANSQRLDRLENDVGITQIDEKVIALHRQLDGKIDELFGLLQTKLKFVASDISNEMERLDLVASLEDLQKTVVETYNKFVGVQQQVLTTLGSMLTQGDQVVKSVVASNSTMQKSFDKAVKQLADEYSKIADRLREINKTITALPLVL